MIGRKGIRDALLAAVLFGLSTPIAKILVGNLSPQLLAGLLYIGSGIGLTILALVRSGTPRADPGLHSADIPFLFIPRLLPEVWIRIALRRGNARAARTSPSCTTRSISKC